MNDNATDLLKFNSSQILKTVILAVSATVILIILFALVIAASHSSGKEEAEKNLNAELKSLQKENSDIQESNATLKKGLHKIKLLSEDSRIEPTDRLYDIKDFIKKDMESKII